MRTTYFQMLTAAVLVVALPGAVATANEYYGGDGGCYGDCGCDGGCDGDGACYGNGCDGCYGGGHCHGRGHKGPCYWCGGCGPCCGGGACCCYGNCGCGDCGYMLPIRRAQWYNWNRNYAYTDFGQTDRARRATDRQHANQLWLGRGQLTAVEDRPSVPAQLPRWRSWRRPLRRPEPPDAHLAQRHHAVWRLLRPRAVVI